MRSKIAILLVATMSLSAMLFMACQTKEVTSAKVYIQQDNWDKAIEQLEEAVSLYPGDAEAHYLLGDGYGNQGKWLKMNEMFDKSLAIGSTFEPQIKSIKEKHWVTTFNSGVNRINGEDTEGALKQFKTCLAIDPNRAEAYKNLAFTYMRLDSLQEARVTYKKFLDVEPENVETIHALANLNFQLKNYDEVVELETKVLELNPKDSDAVANLALAYDFLGEKEKAMATYEKAIQDSPDDKDLVFNLARLHYVNGDYDKAVALFQKVIAIDPEDFDSNLNVGNAYLQMADEYRKSLAKREEAGEEITQEDMDKLIEYYRQSIPYMEKASEKKPEDANIWNNLGVAHIQAGNAEKGKECFDKAEELKAGQ
jgi:tetratricopeptide (TPR) repeat protein